MFHHSSREGNKDRPLKTKRLTLALGRKANVTPFRSAFRYQKTPSLYKTKYLKFKNLRTLASVTVSYCCLLSPQDARHAAEGEIYTKLNQKIDEFVQLADYDWTMAESDGRASGYLMDLINFLRSIFQVFTHLPVSINHF